MKWLGLLAPIAFAGACGSKASPVTGDGAVAFQLELPHGALDPVGFTTVDVVLHEPAVGGAAGKDVELTATIKDGAFDLGTIEPIDGVAIEATLRNDSGAAVGYGRITGATFGDGSTIALPVRRPIAYIAGTVSRDADGNASTPGLAWTEAPATYVDLSTGTPLDGKTELTGSSVLTVSAGPNLYAITQTIDASSGALTGMAQVVPVSAADHKPGAALTGSMTGAVLDGAGTDDGAHLVIGTTTDLFAIDTQTGAVTMLATGSFSRVAIVTTQAGEVDAIAIKSRAPTTGTCAATAELWWAPISGGSGGSGGAARAVATGGFSDVAADRGQGYYVDACKRELGTLSAAGTSVARSLADVITAGEPTALSVSNGQAYVGIETPPATTSLMVASLGSADAPRMLWTETAHQVVEAVNFAGVQRQLDASSAVLDQLEVGAGGDYVALTTHAHFHGDPVTQANFPEMTIDTEELRVFDASTGGSVQRYRSWCDGVVSSFSSDIRPWQCASAAGQTAPAPDDPQTMVSYDHHIGSMTFLYGKK